MSLSIARMHQVVIIIKTQRARSNAALVRDDILGKERLILANNTWSLRKLTQYQICIVGCLSYNISDDDHYSMVCSSRFLLLFCFSLQAIEIFNKSSSTGTWKES